MFVGGGGFEGIATPAPLKILIIHIARRADMAGIVVIDLDGLLFRNGIISIPFELEQVEFGMLIHVIPLPEMSQKEYSLRKWTGHRT